MNISEQISTNLQTIAENEQKVFDAGYELGKSEGGGTGIVVDDVLNANSTNPIQNKAVAEAFDNYEPIKDIAQGAVKTFDELFQKAEEADRVFFFGSLNIINPINGNGNLKTGSYFAFKCYDNELWCWGANNTMYTIKKSLGSVYTVSSDEVKHEEVRFPTVDQTYNPESENAQSGVAITGLMNIVLEEFGTELGNKSDKSTTEALEDRIKTLEEGGGTDLTGYATTDYVDSAVGDIQKTLSLMVGGI